MFEDSTFASTGRIRSRSRAGLLVATVVDSAAAAALVLIPLLYPHMLPRAVSAFLLNVPPVEVERPKPPVRVEEARVMPAILDMGIHAPRTIPRSIYYVDKPEPRIEGNIADLADPRADASDVFAAEKPINVTRGADRTMRVPSTIVEGLIVKKTLPVYPPIARETRTQGTVVLEATISRNGTIENLRVESGPQLLRQAALDAVGNWRYRPYLLNGSPIEVETTVNVVFRLNE
jgi:protein TonB